jgi:hypothetical protein
MIFEEKITSSKTSFQMASMYWRWTHIPQWGWGSCGYIGDGRIFRSGGMHVNIFG